MKARNPKSATAVPARGSVTRISAKRKKPAVTASELFAAETIDLSRVLHDLEQMCPVNASRVVKLHDRIGSGEYVVDAGKVADKLLQLEKALDK